MKYASQRNLRMERARLAKKRRKRNAKKANKFPLGKPFNVIAIQDLIQPTADEDWQQKFSMSEKRTSNRNRINNHSGGGNGVNGNGRTTTPIIVDGLGGTWKVPVTQQASDALLHSLKLRSPKQLGSLNLLELYEGDLISVIGACDRRGTDKSSVARKPVTYTVETEQSKEAQRSKKQQERLRFEQNKRDGDGKFQVFDSNNKHNPLKQDPTQQRKLKTWEKEQEEKKRKEEEKKQKESQWGIKSTPTVDDSNNWGTKPVYDEEPDQNSGQKQFTSVSHGPKRPKQSKETKTTTNDELEEPKQSTVKTKTRYDPVLDPNDNTRMWYGTIVRSGRGAMDEEWPSFDRRQRVGRFPQSAVVMYGPTKVYSDINGKGRLIEDTSIDKNRDQYRCEICSQLTKETRTTSDNLLESLGVIPTASNTGSVGTANEGLFTDVCATCLLKLVNVCQTVASTALLKPSPLASIQTMSNYFHIEATKEANKANNNSSTKPRPPPPSTQGSTFSSSTFSSSSSSSSSTPASPRRRHHYIKEQKINTALATATSNDNTKIVAEITHGSLGIKFNTTGEVQKILKNTQGYKILNLSKGDRLTVIDGITVEGMTTKEMLSVLQLRARPFLVTFAKHHEWCQALSQKDGISNTPSGLNNGLPEVDIEQISELFGKHDQDKSLALTPIELASLMADVHEISSEKRGRDIESGYFPLELASRLVDAYDTNGDGGLDLVEIMDWYV